MKKMFSIIVIAMVAAAMSPPGKGVAADRLIHTVSVYQDSKERHLVRPEGVGCNDESLFVVADSGNGRLVKYSLKGDTIQDGSEISIPELHYPTRVQVTKGGDIFALDGVERRILHIGPDGGSRGYVEPRGLPEPAEIIARSFKIGSDGNMYILDLFGGRVVVTDPGGNFLRQLRLPDDYGFISDVATDVLGGVFLLDSVRASIYQWDDGKAGFVPLTGSLKEHMNFPVSFVVGSKGTFYVVDEYGGGVVILGRDGSYQGRQLSMGWNEALLRYPAQICVNEQDAAFIADRQNNRVQVFTIVH